MVVLVALVAWVVLGPLRAGAGALEHTEDERRAALEAAEEAKYRETRDAEPDHGRGKLSREDGRAPDRELRARAIEILRALDALPPPADEEETESAAPRGANLSLRWNRSSTSP